MLGIGVIHGCRCTVVPSTCRCLRWRWHYHWRRRVGDHGRRNHDRWGLDVGHRRWAGRGGGTDGRTCQTQKQQWRHPTRITTAMMVMMRIWVGSWRWTGPVAATPIGMCRSGAQGQRQCGRAQALKAFVHGAPRYRQFPASQTCNAPAWRGVDSSHRALHKPVQDALAVRIQPKLVAHQVVNAMNVAD